MYFLLLFLILVPFCTFILGVLSTRRVYDEAVKESSKKLRAELLKSRSDRTKAIPESVQ